MPASPNPSGRSGPLSFRASFCARASLAVLAVTFIALLGGLHPTAAQRDAVLAVAALAFAALNAPTAIWLVRRRPFDVLAGSIVGLLLLRCLAAVWILSLVHSVGHERVGPAVGQSSAPELSTPPGASTP